MKKLLLMSSIIGLFLVTSMDLQARNTRNGQQRQARSGISSGQTRHVPSVSRSGSYGRNDNRQGRSVRGGTSFGQSRQAPARDRNNSYGQYGNRYNNYSQFGNRNNSNGQYGNRYNSYSRYGNRNNSYGRYDNRRGRYGRGGIFLGLSIFAPRLTRYSSYGRYYNQPGRYVANEIRSNEERIWNLEQRIESLYRYGDSFGEIRELEQEINYLQRRNDFLRSQLYY